MLSEAQGKTLADMIVLRKKMRADVDKVLTEDQRQKLHEMFEHGRQHPITQQTNTFTRNKLTATSKQNVAIEADNWVIQFALGLKPS